MTRCSYDFDINTNSFFSIDLYLCHCFCAMMAGVKSSTKIAKTLAGISNLVKLLPTTTLQAFITLNPTFTNHGSCLRSNRFLTAFLIIICSMTCAFFSITDSVMHKGKLYIGVATLNGIYILNFDEEDSDDVRTWFKNGSKYKLKISDGVHVSLTVIIFLCLSLSNGYVQSCFFAGKFDDSTALLTYFPSGFSILASMVLLLMPKARKGLGYSPDTEDTPDDGIELNQTSIDQYRPRNEEMMGNEDLGSKYKYIHV